MKRLLYLTMCSMFALFAKAQEEQTHALPRIDTAINANAMLPDKQTDTTVKVSAALKPKAVADSLSPQKQAATIAAPVVVKPVPVADSAIQTNNLPQRDTAVNSDSVLQIKHADTSAIVMSLAANPMPAVDSITLTNNLPQRDTAINTGTTLPNKQVDTTTNLPPINGSVVAKPKPVVDPISKTQEQEAPQKSYDDRWFVSPGLRIQAQSYSVKNNEHAASDDLSKLPFGKKTNTSFAVSVYRNLSKRISVSGDVGLSFGKVMNTTTTKNESKTYNVASGSIYYHLLADNNKLQPYLSAGIYHFVSDVAYTSAPLGAGIKYHGNGMMATAQVAYAYNLKKNIINSNPLMYSIGIYLPLKARKKLPSKELLTDAKKDEPNKEADSSGNAIAAKKGNMLNNGFPNINIFIMTPPYDNKTGKKPNGHNSDGSDDGDRDNQSLSDGKDIRRQIRNGDPANPFNYPPLSKYTIFFNYDLYSLTSSAFNVLDDVVYQLKTNSNLYVDLLGYTDLIGSEEYNQPLSKKRAEVTYEYLKSRGIPLNRMFMNYFGKENPVVNTTDPNASWRNRRTEIVLYEKK